MPMPDAKAGVGVFVTYNLTLLLVDASRPFAQYDWPLPLAHPITAYLRPAIASMVNLTLSMPFRQTNWPLPVIGVDRKHLLSWIQGIIRIPGSESAQNRLPPPNVTLMSGPPNVRTGERSPNVGGKS